LISSTLCAQSAEGKKITLGVQLAVDQTQMQYRLADWVYNAANGLEEIDAEAGLGFSAGLVAEFKLTNKTALRIAPLFSVQNNRLVFTAENNQEMTFEVQPKSIGLPIHFIFSPRGDQKMPYFFIGPRIQQHLGEQIDPMVFSVNPTDLSGEFGVGIKLQYNRFSILPQLSFSQGFSDLKAIGQSGLYNNAIRSMSRNRLSLSVVVTR